MKIILSRHSSSLITLLLLSCYPAGCQCLSIRNPQRSASTPCSVQVCRNKNCCQQSPQLLETVSDLLGGCSGATTVESSGCLSQCEKGPNVRIELPGKPLLFLHGLKTVQNVLVQLEIVTDGAILIPKLLGAAARVIERVQATKDPIEQERLLNSVVAQLAAPECEHNQSTALAHAYALRARAFADQQKWSLAIEDAQKVVLAGTDSIDGNNSNLRLAATDASLSLSYRVWADAEEQLSLVEVEDEENAKRGDNHHQNKERVIAVLQHWQKAQPSFRTKLQREMQEFLKK